MKKIAISMAVLAISAFTVQAQLVWPTETTGIIFKKFGPKIDSVKPPDGFIIPPAEVSEMFSPRKFAIMIYSSDTHYFVTRYSRDQTYKKAQLLGVAINGRTGVVEKKGLDLQVLRQYDDIRKKKASNQASKATSEPAPGAFSAAPLG